MSTLTVFKGSDGRWLYCPTVTRNWPAFKQAPGNFDTKEQAVEAAKREGAAVKVEGGLLSSWFG